MNKILAFPILPLASAAGAGDIEDGLAASNKKNYATVLGLARNGAGRWQ